MFTVLRLRFLFFDLIVLGMEEIFLGIFGIFIQELGILLGKFSALYYGL